MIERQNELIRTIDAQLNLDDKFITKRKQSDFELKADDNDLSTKLVDSDKSDLQVLRQQIYNRALEKVRLKSDEALGITTPDNIKHLVTPITLAVLASSEVKTKLENEDNKELFDKIFSKAKEKIKNQVQKDKEKSSDSSSSLSIKTENSPAPIATFDELDDIYIDENDISINKSLTSSNFNSTEHTDSTNLTVNSINTASQSLITPLLSKVKEDVAAKKEESVKPKNLKFVLNSISPPDKQSSSEQTKPNEKKSNYKTKIAKLLSPSDHQKSSSKSPSTSPFSSPRETIQNVNNKQMNGILKGSSNSRKNESDPIQQPDEQETSNSFQFTITGSPRLGRNSRTVKRQQTEEKRLERVDKERRDKRLRMSQELQRKLDEVETKLIELEHEGVALEKIICSMDNNENPERKEKLEQDLYNLIHQKNLFTRVENELNIQ